MPELLLRVSIAHDPAHVPAAARAAHDVVVGLEPTHTTGELVAALAEHLGWAADGAGLRIDRTGRVVLPDTPLADVDLLAGDAVAIGVLSAACAVDDPSVDRPAGVMSFDVVAGPDSGRMYLLHEGDNSIGRGSAADVSVADPSVSRRHATLTVDARGAASMVVEPAAGNGAAVDGVPVVPGEPMPVGPDSVVGLGSTRAVIRRLEPGERERRDRLGQVGFHRTPYRPPTVADHDVAPIGPVPTRPQPRRLQIIAVLAPLVAGVGMYAVTRQAQFLLFTLISPVVMVGTALDDRRTGRRSFAADLETFRGMLGERRAQLAALASAEATERHRAAPDLAQLVRRAERRAIDLWERGRDAPDVCRVRLGLGVDTAGFEPALQPGGDDDLRAEALATVAGVERLHDVPVTVDLGAHLLGVHGPADLVRGVAASLVVQMATLHSPDDVTIVAAVSPARRLGWTKWLPHLRSVTSPVAGRHLVITSVETDALVARLIEVAEFRTGDEHRRREVPWPRVLAVIDGALEPDPAGVARLLDLASPAGIGVVWLTDDASGVPRQLDRILAVEYVDGARMSGRLWATDPAVAERRLEVEHLRTDVADAVARALAPIRDASTGSLTTSIPRVAPLLDVLDLAAPSPAAIAERWVTRYSADPGHHLRFPVGFDAVGPLDLDLVADGPHALIGGTSGAGKSELVQSMVAALAASAPPTDLNFLFVDYKGGASSQVFERLPHTVGYVTNLSADLALRALTSLRAELQHRMALLEGKAKDLAEMRALHPDDAPASLVIVVDEFATLVKEVPEFVAGVVDIAQRGRSLGIHLVLATQRPSGSVDENILANTNLRISLRMLDRTESSAVIDAPDAAGIPVPLRGRGFVRRGPGRLVEFQSAFGGAALTADDTRRPVVVGDFDAPGDLPAVGTSGPTAGIAAPSTHLEVLLDAIAGAAEAWGGPPPRRPWREVLPDVVTLDDLLADAEPRLEAGRDLVVGMLDAPETQTQRPAVVDVEATGGLLVVGSGGSGKTTLLRTIAAGVDRGAGDAATLVFDFASRGLASLRDLPSVIDVANGDDLEAVTRHLLVLDAELDRRRRLLADARAEHLTAYRGAAGGSAVERIIVLIDGFSGLAAGLLDAAGPLSVAGAERWSDIVHRVVAEGRQLGIHTVIATDRRASLPQRLQSAVGARLVLRHADPQAYADLGVRSDRASVLEAAAGRALLDGATTVQLATVSAEPSARAQSAVFARLARTAPRTKVLASSPLPDSLVTDRDAIGVADVTGAPVGIDVDWSHAAIVGPPRSGRSAAVVAFVDALGARDGAELYAVGPTSSPLARTAILPADRVAFGSTEVVGALLDRVANLTMVAPDGPCVVIGVDDLDALDDPTLEPVWQRLLASDRVRLVASIESRSMTGYSTNPALIELRRARRLLVLQPDDPTDFLQLTGVKLPARPGLRWVPGRGVLLVDRQPTIIHVARRVSDTLRARHDTAVDLVNA